MASLLLLALLFACLGLAVWQSGKPLLPVSDARTQMVLYIYEA
ncbi:MAG: hypothetical protein AABZ77_09310 [Chloroflexota bacterium]